MPFGLLIARWWAGVDIREHGSRNIGATNVYRVVGKPAGAIVFALDILKGVWPPLAMRAVGGDSLLQALAGMAAITGHSVSPFLRFKGGKSVATSLGVLFGLSWQVGLGCFILWVSVLWTTGYVSLASMIGGVAATPLMFIFCPGDVPRITLAVIGGALVVFKHRSNIQRLRAGTENSFKKKKDVV